MRALLPRSACERVNEGADRLRGANAVVARGDGAGHPCPDVTSHATIAFIAVTRRLSNDRVTRARRT